MWFYVYVDPRGDVPLASWNRWPKPHGGADAGFNSCYAAGACGTKSRRRPATALLVGPSVLFAIFVRESVFFFGRGSAKCNEKWYCFGEARHPLTSLENHHEWSENFAKYPENLKKNWRNRPDLKVYCLEHVYVLGFMTTSKSPWEFSGSTGHLYSLLEPSCRSGLVFWQEILHIGTLRARYRAEHRNVTDATVSTTSDGGEAHVAYEDGMKKILPKKISRTSLRPLARICLKK